MAIKGKVGGSFEMTPAGVHKARCVRVVDMGTQHNVKFDTLKRKVMFMFELPKTQMADGKPFAICRSFTLSMHKKSNLRPFLESWRGSVFKDDEAGNFDISKLAGIPCTLNIIHDGDYAKIKGIMPCKKSECPKQINDSFIFDLDDYSDERFGQLSEKMQEYIKITPEWAKLNSKKNRKGEEIEEIEETEEIEEDSFVSELEKEEEEEGAPF